MMELISWSKAPASIKLIIIIIIIVSLHLYFINLFLFFIYKKYLLFTNVTCAGWHCVIPYGMWIAVAARPSCLPEANRCNAFITLLYFTCLLRQGRLTSLHYGWKINPPHVWHSPWGTLHLVWAEHEGTILHFDPVWLRNPNAVVRISTIYNKLCAVYVMDLI